MVNLDFLTALRPAAEFHGPARVRLDDGARRYQALGPLRKAHRSEVPPENVVAGVAAVPVNILPRLPERLPLVRVLRRTSLDGQLLQGGPGTPLRYRVNGH